MNSMKLVVLSGEAKIFSQGCFVNIEEALRWVTKMLREEVEIVLRRCNIGSGIANLGKGVENFCHIIERGALETV
jgi:hypothetical protein